MTKKYQRNDYPAQCFNAGLYPQFIQRYECKGSASIERVLIVANNLDCTDKFNSLFDLVRFFNGISPVDILYLEECSKGVASFERMLGHAGIDASIYLLPKIVPVLQSPISDALEDSYQFNVWLKQSSRQYEAVFAFECLPLLHYPLLCKQLNIQNDSIRFIAFSAIQIGLKRLNPVRQFLTHLS